MLFQILWTLERFATQVTLMRLQGYVNTDVRGDMVAFDRGRSTRAPLASEVEVVSTLAAYMALADVFLDLLSVSHTLTSNW